MGMIFKKYIVFSLSFYVLWLQAFAANGQDYRLVTGFLPPWSMSSDDEYPGFFVEIAREVDRRLGQQTKIEVYPWARALEIAQQSPDVIIFPLAKTKERETVYTWIGSIKPMEMVFVSLKQKVHSFEEARSLKRVLVHKGAPPDLYLEQHDFKNLAKLHTLTSSIPRMLLYDRADAWYTPKDMAHWMWKLNPDLDTPYFSTAYTTDDLTFAGSPHLSGEIAKRFGDVLVELKNENFVEKAILKYRR